MVCIYAATVEKALVASFVDFFTHDIHQINELFEASHLIITWIRLIVRSIDIN